MVDITHINDVLPHIEGYEGFIHAVKDGYQVIDYVYIDPEAFDDPVRLECRGLKFDMDGNLIARPLHKFFNIGERGIMVNDIDWSRPHIVMDKRDGTMIHACLLNGEVRLMTRMGLTEHALRCEERHLTHELKDKLLFELKNGWTPIFEWTSFDNQIVLRYDDDQLTLLAIRKNSTGEYVGRNGLAVFSNFYGLPLVEKVQLSVDDVHAATGIEGVVIWFTDNDYFVKVKADEYVTAHRAVSFFDREKHVLELVLNGGVDDLVPVLPKEKADKLLEYERAVNHELTVFSESLLALVGAFRDIPRKEFATDIVPKIAKKELRSAAFRILDGHDALTTIKECVSKHPEILETKWIP